MEHQGMTEHRQRLEREIRETLHGNRYGVDPEPVIRDLFSTMSPPLKGYRRMAWIVGRLDNGHWDEVPSQAREWNIAERFRKENPGVPIRLVLVDAPVTHYGHIERPRSLAAMLVDAARWVTAN
jgi:hypothetical protein